MWISRSVVALRQHLLNWGRPRPGKHLTALTCNVPVFEGPFLATGPLRSVTFSPAYRLLLRDLAREQGTTQTEALARRLVALYNAYKPVDAAALHVYTERGEAPEVCQ